MRPQARRSFPSIDDSRSGLHRARPVQQGLPLMAVRERCSRFIQLRSSHLKVMLDDVMRIASKSGPSHGWVMMTRIHDTPPVRLCDLYCSCPQSYRTIMGRPRRLHGT